MKSFQPFKIPNPTILLFYSKHLQANSYQALWVTFELTLFHRIYLCMYIYTQREVLHHIPVNAGVFRHPPLAGGGGCSTSPVNNSRTNSRGDTGEAANESSWQDASDDAFQFDFVRLRARSGSGHKFKIRVWLIYSPETLCSEEA